MTIFKASRALTVRSAAIPEVSGAPALVPLKLQGREGINSLFHYTLALQTPDALQFSGIGSNFRLDDFIGREITCSIELEGMGSFQAGMPGGLGASHQGAGVREISGLITAARFCTEDHRHAIYELEIRPWLYLATLTTDCKVFQDQTPVEVIEAVLAGYNFASDKRLIETYPPRDYCVQYNETNFEFITRLMQERGINYHFEHTACVHRLVWSDHNGAFQAASQDQGEGPGACHDIPYYPLGHKIDREYIHGFSPTGRITSGAYATRDHDYTRPRATLEASARDLRINKVFQTISMRGAAPRQAWVAATTASPARDRTPCSRPCACRQPTAATASTARRAHWCRRPGSARSARDPACGPRACPTPIPPRATWPSTTAASGTFAPATPCPRCSPGSCSRKPPMPTTPTSRGPG